jgi:Ca2+-binding RTX toxin-like protein
MARIDGDENDNILFGTPLADRIYGFGGNDELFGGDGDDRLWGGEGNDRLFGEAGFNVLFGEDGNDYLTSISGRLYGGDGNDILNGGGALYGQAGDDNLSGLGNNNFLVGGTGNDYLYGAGGFNTLQGGAGNDTLVEAAGQETLDGGGGLDQLGLSFSGNSPGIAYDFNPVNGQLVTPKGSTVVNVESVNIFGSDGGDSFGGGAFGDLLRGWQGNDRLDGRAGSDFLIGDNGADTIYGGAGNDTLLGGGHGDILYGGDGDDFLRGGATFDLFQGDNTLEGGAGADTIWGGSGRTTVSYQSSGAGVYVDFARGIGFGGDAQGDVFIDGAGTVYLSEFNDLVIGAAQQFGLGGDDVLVQGAGTRDMAGGAGRDVFELTFNTQVIFEPLTIADFDQAAGEKINLSPIDAKPRPGNDAFSFIGTAAFTGVPGEVRWFNDGGNTVVELQVNADANPDYRFVLTGLYTLSAADFVL